MTDPTQRKLHRVHQYHFTAWPDHSTPEDPSTVLSFLQDIRSQRRRLSGASKKSDSPMIVHCCNGLGRTGALIVIDIVLNILQSKGKYKQHHDVSNCFITLALVGLHNEIDIWNSVQLVRTQRPGMVQTDVSNRYNCRHTDMHAHTHTHRYTHTHSHSHTLTLTYKYAHTYTHNNRVTLLVMF